MKTNSWLVLGMLVATSAVAQVSTNSLPAILPPVTATPAPVAAPKTEAPAVAPKKEATAKAVVKKPVVKHKKIVAKAPAKPVEKKIAGPYTPLVAGPATVTAEKVNLRGQAGLKGEVVGHVKKGDAVTVITEINLDKPAAGEPAHWAKIALPSDNKVWVNSQFIDATNKVVTARKLNMRGGPGENYSVLGILEKGAAITVVTTKGEWTQIEPPTHAFAFISAGFLSQEAAVTPPPQPPVVAVVPPTPSVVPEAQPIVTQPPTPIVTPVVAPIVAPVLPPQPPAVVEPPVMVLDTNPPPPRIVTHEGYVRSSVSIVAPTYYELYDAGNGKAINYLFSTTTNLDLGRYEGLHINVTGEEGLEARWKDTPVITVQKIYVLGTNAPAKKARFHLW